MFKDDIFEEWLDSESKTVLEKFKNNEPLTIEDKMILTLKAQTNHFYHLDEDIRKDIKEFRDEQNKKWDEQNKKWEEQNRKWDDNTKNIQKIYESINNQTWKMVGAVGLIVILGKLIDTFGK